MKTKQNAKTTANQEPADGKPLEAPGLKGSAGVQIRADLVNANERRAFALAYRRTQAGQKLDFMPGGLISALCRGIAAAVFHAERVARETGIAAEAIAAALTGQTPEEPNRAALLDAGAQIDG